MKVALALFLPAALVLAAIYTSQARAREHEHEHEKEYCEHHEPPVVHQPPTHEIVVHEPAREVILHRELREREPRDDCHNQWVVDSFCKARVAK